MCRATTKTDQESDLHTPTTHTDESVPKCGICKYESDDENEMQVHTITNHENPYSSK